MANYLSYAVKKGEHINRFLVAGTYTRQEVFEKLPLSGKVNEWLEKGFSIHENPCRKEFLASRLKNPPVYPQIGEIIQGKKYHEFESESEFAVYFPFGNVGVDASRFYYTPTYLRSYSYAEIFCSKQEMARLSLTVCGGLTIWLNGEMIEDFTPFTRNMKKHKELTVNFTQGANSLMVCLDDLAERDTDYYFRIKYLGENEIKINLPISEQAAADKIFLCEKFLSDVRCPKEVYLDEDILFEFGSVAAEDYKLIITASPSVSTKINEAQSLDRKFSQIIKKGEQRILVKNTCELPAEYYYCKIEVEICGIKIERKLGTQVFKKYLQTTPSPDINTRKNALIEYTANFCADNSYMSAAIYHLGGDLQKAERLILNDLVGIRELRDCSDFYFITILSLYDKYASKMSETLKTEIKNTALGFRYWIDEPGNDVMWFFSENHALLFHICQYFAGTLFPDDKFEYSGLDGRKLKIKAEKLLNSWFEDFGSEFITEWNSSAYIPIDALGLACLYKFERSDSTFKEKAKKSLDMISRCLSIGAHEGALMTTSGRSYEKQLCGNYTAGTSSMLYLLYGHGYINGCAAGYISLATCDYCPPEKYTKYLQMPKGRGLVFKNTQGYKNHVNMYIYKSHSSVISAAIGFKPFEAGYQEHIVQASINPLAQAFVGHPGEIQPFGSGRPSYLAGNASLPLVGQFENFVVAQFDFDDNYLVQYTHAYLPVDEFDEVVCDTNAVAAKKDGGFIGIYSKTQIQLSQNGVYKNKEYIAKGNKNVWVIMTFEQDEFKDTKALLAYLAGIDIIVTDQIVKVIMPEKQRNVKFELMRSGEFLVNGVAAYNYPLNPEGIVTILNKGAIVNEQTQD